MFIIDFIGNHWTSILLVVIFLVIVAILAARGKKQIIYKMLYALVCEAEDRYGDGAGKIQFAEVMTGVYAMLPAILRLFITYDTLALWIERAVAEMKADLAEKAGAEQTEGGTMNNDEVIAEDQGLLSERKNE